MRRPEALFEHLPGVIKNYVWPGEVYTVVDEIRYVLFLNQVPDRTTRKSPGAQQPSTRMIL
jgi:hypothetical protein